MNYIDKIIQSDGTNLPDNCIVCFHGTWSSICFKMLEFLSNIKSDISILRVNIGENPSVRTKYSILICPTVIFFEKGKEKNRFNGYDVNFENEFAKLI